VPVPQSGAMQTKTKPAPVPQSEKLTLQLPRETAVQVRKMAAVGNVTAGEMASLILLGHLAGDRARP